MASNFESRRTQNGRRASRLSGKPLDAVVLDAHLGQCFPEGIVIQKVEGNIRLARSMAFRGRDDDAAESAIDGRQFAFRLLGVNDRNER